MASQEIVTVDPDPMDLQYQTSAQVKTDGFTPADFCKPEVVAILMHQYRVNVAQVKAVQKQVEELRAENRDLTREKEALRIASTQAEERLHYGWVEILVSAMLGFSVGRLVNNPADLAGWFISLVSIAMLLVLRYRPRKPVTSASDSLEHNSGH